MNDYFGFGIIVKQDFVFCKQIHTMLRSVASVEPPGDLLGSLPMREQPLMDAKIPSSAASNHSTAVNSNVKGQFEDADDDDEDLLLVFESKDEEHKTGNDISKSHFEQKTKSSESSDSKALDFLAHAACGGGDNNATVPPRHELERRVSTSTCDASQSLLTLANAAMPGDAEEAPSKSKRKPQKSWQARVQELVDYKRVHGHANVRQEVKGNPHHKELGAWVANARYDMYLRKTVSIEVIMVADFAYHLNHFFILDVVFDWGG